jgi:hypothetical protein
MKPKEAVYVWSHTSFEITDDLPDSESAVLQEREWRTAKGELEGDKEAGRS